MAEESLRKIIDQTSADHRADLEAGSWWHSIRLKDGTITRGVHSIEELEENYRHFALPEDLTGKRVLDMGCWDGFYSFEAEKTWRAGDCGRLLAASQLSQGAASSELECRIPRDERVRA